MADLGNRRVVTGLDAEGRSCVIIDGPIPVFNDITAALAWQTKTLPADNSGNDDAAEPYSQAMLHTPGSTFSICEFHAGMTDVFMHATDSIDYIVILKGRVTLVTEDGEADLGPGDFVVDRGVYHGWRNPHDEPCQAMAINLPAHPVGRGRTI